MTLQVEIDNYKKLKLRRDSYKTFSDRWGWQHSLLQDCFDIIRTYPNWTEVFYRECNPNN